eukprot:1852863-Prymnesium_polylepis.1
MALKLSPDSTEPVKWPFIIASFDPIPPTPRPHSSTRYERTNTTSVRPTQPDHGGHVGGAPLETRPRG